LASLTTTDGYTNQFMGALKASIASANWADQNRNGGVSAISMDHQQPLRLYWVVHHLKELLALGYLPTKTIPLRWSALVLFENDSGDKEWHTINFGPDNVSDTWQVRFRRTAQYLLVHNNINGLSGNTISTLGTPVIRSRMLTSSEFLRLQTVMTAAESLGTGMDDLVFADSMRCSRYDNTTSNSTVLQVYVNSTKKAYQLGIGSNLDGIDRVMDVNWMEITPALLDADNYDYMDLKNGPSSSIYGDNSRIHSWLFANNAFERTKLLQFSTSYHGVMMLTEPVPSIVIKLDGPMGSLIDLTRLYLRDAIGNEIAYEVVANTDIRTYLSQPTEMLIQTYPNNPLHYIGVGTGDRAIWTTMNSGNPVPQIGDTLLTLYPVGSVSTMEIVPWNNETGRTADFHIEYMGAAYKTPASQSTTPFFVTVTGIDTTKFEAGISKRNENRIDVYDVVPAEFVGALKTAHNHGDVYNNVTIQFNALTEVLAWLDNWEDGVIFDQAVEDDLLSRGFAISSHELRMNNGYGFATYSKQYNAGETVTFDTLNTVTSSGAFLFMAFRELPLPIVIKQNADVTPEGPDIDRIILRDSNNNEIPYDVIVNSSYRFHPGSDPNYANQTYGTNPLHIPTTNNLQRLTWTAYDIDGYTNPVAQIGDTLMTLYPVSTVYKMETRKFKTNRRFDFQVEYKNNTFYTSSAVGSGNQNIVISESAFIEPIAVPSYVGGNALLVSDLTYTLPLYVEATIELDGGINGVGFQLFESGGIYGIDYRVGDGGTNKLAIIQKNGSAVFNTTDEYVGNNRTMRIAIWIPDNNDDTIFYVGDTSTLKTLYSSRFTGLASSTNIQFIWRSGRQGSTVSNVKILKQNGGTS